MGLPNIKRCVDKMTLDSSPGKGTRLDMTIICKPRTASERQAIFPNENGATCVHIEILPSESGEHFL
jgi:hypothetical protein